MSNSHNFAIDLNALIGSDDIPLAFVEHYCENYENSGPDHEISQMLDGLLITADRAIGDNRANVPIILGYFRTQLEKKFRNQQNPMHFEIEIHRFCGELKFAFDNYLYPRLITFKKQRLHPDIQLPNNVDNFDDLEIWFRNFYEILIEIQCQNNLINMTQKPLLQEPLNNYVIKSCFISHQPKQVTMKNTK